MGSNLKTVILISTFFASPLAAESFINFYAINWNWAAVAFLTVIFGIILLSIVKDFKRERKKLQTKITKEKCKNRGDKKYLSEISSNSLESVKKLGENIDKLNMNNNIIDEIKRNHKEIFNTVQEENIFSHVAANKRLGKIEIFDTEDIYNGLIKIGLIGKNSIKVKRKATSPILANKELLQAVLFLFIKLQTKEHGLKRANVVIDVDEINDTITFTTPNQLKLNSYQKDIFFNDLTPKYIESEKKYYGIYLYLINKLVNRVNGKLKIVINSNKKYKAEAIIPIDFDKPIEVVNNKINKELKTSKKALIISNDIKTINKTEAYLYGYKFIVDIEVSSDINKNIPNFLNYDAVFMDAELFEPILSDYIQSVKKYNNLKIVSLEKNGRIYEYPAGLIDGKINKEHIDSDINPVITKLFSRDLVEVGPLNEIEEKKQEESTPKVIIAEDDRTNLHILEHLIKSYGIEVFTASNGEEVLKILEKEESFNLIILDSIMPKLDGFETVKRIRENSRFNSTPVVIHTSFSLHKNRIEDIFKLGFDSYLPKPFNNRELKAMLERYLPLNSIKTETLNLNNKDALREFIAIYGDSDKLIERYIKENRSTQLLLMLNDIKKMGQKIGAKKFLDIVRKMESKISASEEIDGNLLYQYTEILAQLKSDIAKRLK